jgi:diacylglycerol kinase (ATP)
MRDTGHGAGSPPIDHLAPPGRMRVLWNPASGRKAGVPTGSTTRATVEDLVGRIGPDAELVETHSEEEALEAVRDAVDHHDRVVVAAGGDGTIGGVARALLDTDTALGILPLGSIMNIPRMLGIPRDLDAAVGILRDGRTRRIDVGDGPRGVFFEAASVGFYPAVFEEAAKADHGDPSGIIRSVLAALRYRPSRMTIELGQGRRRETRALMVAIANGPYMGLGFSVAPDASLDDGLFDVRVFERYSKRELVRHFVSIAFGRRAYAPRAVTLRAAEVRVIGHRPLPARSDAVDLGATPVRFAVRPQALLVVAPSHAAGTPAD